MTEITCAASLKQDRVSSIQKFNAYFYYVGIFVYCVNIVLSRSTFTALLSDFFFSSTKLLCILLFCLAAVTKVTVKISRVLIAILSVVLALLVYQKSQSVTPLIFVLSIYSVPSENIQSVLRLFIFSLLFSCLIVVFSALCGIIPNIYRPGVYFLLPYDLGFSYGSMPGYYLEGISIATILYFRGRIPKLTGWIIVFSSLLNFLFWGFVTQSFIVLLALIGTFVLDQGRESRTDHKYVRVFSILSFCLIPLVFFFVNYFFSEGNPVMQFFNRLLTWRLGLGRNALHAYGVSLFGKNVSFSGFGFSPTDMAVSSGGRLTLDSSSTYDYVDSSYVINPILYGVVCALLIIFFYMMLAVKSYKANLDYVCFLLIVLAIQGCVNWVLFELYLNPLPLFAALLFSDKKTINF